MSTTYDLRPIGLANHHDLRLAAAALRKAARVRGKKRLPAHERSALEDIAAALMELTA